MQKDKRLSLLQCSLKMSTNDFLQMSSATKHPLIRTL